MNSLVEFVTPLHTRSKRNYIERVVQYDKAQCAKIAKKWGFDYWDGERQYGFGGYKYDGRWKTVAEKMIAHYQLKPDAKILDVGCGKGFLLYEFKQLLPKSHIRGVDISSYAVEHAKEEIRPYLQQAHANQLPFDASYFDLVISNTTLHNLKIFDLKKSLQEIQRVTKGNSWICVESYRSEEEKVNLLYWQLTCESFYSTQEWIWLFNEYGYTGDYEFIYFE